MCLRTLGYDKGPIMSTEEYTQEVVKVSTKHKTTVPKAARQRLDVEEGDKVAFKILSDGTVKVEKHCEQNQ